MDKKLISGRTWIFVKRFIAMVLCMCMLLPTTSSIVTAVDTEDDTVEEIDTSEVTNEEDDGVPDGYVELPEEEDNPLLDETEYSAMVMSFLGDDLFKLEDAPENQAPNQEPVTLDNTTIEKITVRWLSSSDGKTDAAGFGRLELAPTSSKVTNQQFQIDFALSGQTAYEAGDVKIIIPAYIWLDRDDNETGELTLSVPEDPEVGVDFVWKRVGDQIVITNAKRLPAASKVLIQGTFRDLVAWEIEDETQSFAFEATVVVTTSAGNELSMTSNDIDATIDTKVNVTDAKKTAWDSNNKKYNIYWEEVPTAIPTEFYKWLDNDPSEYVYIRWYVQGTAKGSQPFDMTVTDTVENMYGGIMLGATNTAAGAVISPDGKTVTALLYHGYTENYRTAYIWTAYPKDQFVEGVEVEFNNTQTTKVVGWDDGIESEKSADATVKTWSPIHYKFVKVWDDNHDENEVRPDYLWLYIYDYSYSYTLPWKRIALTDSYADENEEDHWIYEWSDEGQPGHNYEVDEELVNHFGSYDSRFDDYEHQLRWNYFLASNDYDPSTHTWTYVNEYDDGWIILELSNIDKDIAAQWKHPEADASTDDVLNGLIRGQSAEIEFYINSHLSVAKPQIEGHASLNRFILEDGTYRFNDTEFGANDIDISYVILNTPIMWMYTTYDLDTGYYNRDVLSDYTMTLYGYVNNEWKPMAYVTDGIVTAVTENGAEASGRRVNLPDNVTKVKTEILSDKATIVYMSYTMGLRLKPSSAIKKAVSDYLDIKDYVVFPVWNRADGYVVYEGDENIDVDGKGYKPGDHLVDIMKTATGYVHGHATKVAANLIKEFAVVGNDTVNRSIIIRSTITFRQQSNLLTEADYLGAIANGDIPNSMSGTYYDLLPYGVSPDIKTISSKTGDTIASVQVIENYRNSGRTMLIIKTNNSNNFSYVRDTNVSSNSTYPAKGYKNEHIIEFDSYVPWDTIQELGVDVFKANTRNVVAYEADEEWVGSIPGWEGEPDNPKYGNHGRSVNAVAEDADYMTGLDKNGCDTPSFVYAGADIEADEIDVRALTSLWKYVQANGIGMWGDGSRNNINVEEGGSYVYQLKMKSGNDTITQNIILVDAIERYVPNEEDDDYGDDQWHGSLVSIDVSNLIKAGVKPVIYYTTKTDIDVSRSAMHDDHDANATMKHLLTDKYEDGTLVWTTETPSDLSKVTAIAIDASKCIDDTDFQLMPNETITVYLHMRAPYEKDNESPAYFKGTDGRNHLLNAHAYNDINLACVQLSAGLSTHDYINYSYTKVGIYDKYINVTKVWDDGNNADGFRPDQLTVHLIANGVDTNRTVILNAENNWSATFDRILAHDENGNQIVYSFREEEWIGSSHYKFTYSQREMDDGHIEAVLTNSMTPEQIDIPVTKLWADDNDNAFGTRPDYVIVHLYADGVDTGKTLILRVDSAGNWKGTYTGLNKNRDGGIPIEYTIVEEPVNDYVSTVNGYTITNTYHPWGNLTIKKNLENATELAATADFTFDIIFTTEKGEPILDKFAYTVYDANGIVKRGEIGDGDEFMLKGGQWITIEHVPTHVLYAITEKTAPGFTQTVSDNVDSVIMPGENYATFVNRYSSNGSLQLDVSKVLSGRQLMSNQFRFDMELPDGTIRTAFNDINGIASFSQIKYTEADDKQTYTYTISEYKANRPGYTYDPIVYTVTVYVHDNGAGSMICDIKHYNDKKQEVGPLVFNNEYHATGNLTFRLWKTINRDIIADEFTFELWNQDYILQGTTTNDKDGMAVFAPVTLHEDSVGKTLYFFVKERKGDDNTVIYSQTILAYAVTVQDNEDGTLSFDSQTYDVSSFFEVCNVCNGLANSCGTCHGFGYVQTVDDIATVVGDAITPVVQNGLKDGSISVTKHVQSITDILPDQEFHFKIKLVGDNINDGDFTYYVEKVENVEFTETTQNISFFENVISSIANAFTSFANSAKSLIGNAINAVQAIFNSSDIVAEGTNGTVQWSIDTDGLLVIEPMDDYEVGQFANGKGRDVIYQPWLNYRTSIYKVEIKGHVKLNETTCGLFLGCENLSYADLSNLDVSEAKEFAETFSNCTQLNRVDLGDWDTSNLTYAPYFFSGCAGLETVTGLENWEMGNNTSLTGFFNGCSVLSEESIKSVEHWDTHSLIEANALFYRCQKVTTLNLSAWDTTHVTTLGMTFGGMTSLVKLDISTWDTTGLTQSVNIFLNCSKLQEVTLSNRFYAGNVGPLPTPGSGSTGKWILKDEVNSPNPQYVYTSAQLKENLTNGTAPAGTYVWQYEGPYTVEFDANGGSGSMEYIVYTSLKDLTLPTCKFTKYGDAFLGWYDAVNDITYTPDADGNIIIPAETYDEGTVVILSAIWEAQTKTAESKEGVIEFTLHGGEKATFENIPAGTTYQVWEETPDGWVLIEQSGTSGVVAPTVTAEAEFTNEYQPGVTSATILGMKYLDNKPANCDANGNTFGFTLEENGNWLQTVGATGNGFIQFNPILYTEEGEHIYTIRELVFDSNIVKYDTHEETVIVTVKKEGNKLVSTVKYENENGMRFDNISVPGVLEINKVGIGLTNANKDAIFSFRVKLYSENGMPLYGMEFPWYVKDTTTGEVVETPNGRPNTAPKRAMATGDYDYPTATADRDILYSGEHGTVQWSIDTDGLLLIEPIDGDEGVLSTEAPNNGAQFGWYNYRSSIKYIKVNGHITFDAPPNSSGNSSVSYMFADCSSLITADIRGLDFTGVVTLTYLFYNNPSLATVDASDIGIDSAKYIGLMFANCPILSYIDARGWNTENVIQANSMFENSSNLVTVAGIEDWRFPELTNPSKMFNGCTRLMSMDLSKWGIQKVTTLESMFEGCQRLNYLNLSSWNVSDVTTMKQTFRGCYMLGSLNLDGWHISNKCTTMYYAFREVGRDSVYGPALDLSGWDVSKVSNMNATFYNGVYKSINFNGWHLGSVNVQNLFGYSTINDLDLSVLAIDNVTNLHLTFYRLNTNSPLDLSAWNVNNVADVYGVFNTCTTPSINVTGWNLSNVTDAGSTTFGSIGSTLKEFTVSRYFWTENNGVYTLPKPGGNSTGKWILKDEIHSSNPEHVYTAADLRQAMIDGTAPEGTYVWQMSSYTVEFVSENSDGSMADGSSFVDSPYELPENGFTRFGYIFTGWADQYGNTYELVDGVATIPANKYGKDVHVILTAQWQKLGDDGSVKYYVDHYQQSTTDTTSYILVDSMEYTGMPGDTVTLETMPYDGFVIPTVRVEVIPNDSVLHVSYYYNRIRYTVHFDGNGADFGRMDDINMIGNISAVLGNGFSKTASAFLGWNTDPDGLGEWYYPNVPVVNIGQDNQTVVLYAQWKTIDTTVESTTGEIIVYCKAGQTIVIPDLPAGVVYDIEEITPSAGWYYDSGENLSGTISSNQTSYASLTNEYIASGQAQIVAHKTLNGGTVRPGQFEFKLQELVNTEVIHSELYTDDGELLYAATSNYPSYYGSSDGTYDWIHVWMKYMAFGRAVINVYTYSNGVNNSDYVPFPLNTYLGSDPEYEQRFDGEYEFDVYVLGANHFTFSFSPTGSWSYNDPDRPAPQYYAVATYYKTIDTAYNGMIDTIGDTSTNQWYGTAPVIFDAIEYTKPGVYTYYISEIVDETDATIDYDTHIETVTVYVDDNGDGTLSTRVAYENGQEPDFENSMKPGNLNVSKELANGTDVSYNTDFSFQLTLRDASGVELTDTYIVEKSNGEMTTVTSGGIVTIKAGENFTVYDLPHDCHYYVKELSRDGFTLAEAEGDEGTIVGGETSYAMFSNVYSGQGALTLSAHKNFIGGIIGTEQFAFVLMNQNNEIIETVYADSEGNVNFTPIYFTESDVGTNLVYRIYEIAGSDNIRYDTHTAEIAITVVDNGDGTIGFDMDYDESELEFTNVALFDLTIDKTVTGSMGNKDEEFTFVLTLDNPTYELGNIQCDKEDALIFVDDHYEFILKHNESITIFGLPAGTTYSIEEVGSNLGKYTTIVTSTVDGVDIVNRKATGELTENTAFSYTNDCAMRLPTDATSTAYGWIGMLVLTSLLLFVIIKKRRYE